MKKIGLIGLFVVIMAVFTAIPATAAPPGNASHVAFCAVTMGGQHVAECARSMEQGVSHCAMMKGPGLCDHGQ